MKNALLRLLGRLGLLRPAFRAYESIKALRGGGATHGDDGLPLPPRQLRVRVAGTADPGWFVEGGRLGAETVRDAVARSGMRVEELASVLDFGCGCGRVTRQWARLDGVRVCGSDQDERAVEWCRRNLPFARFEENGLAPPIAYDDGAFELVYAFSVFTHLAEELQQLWLIELDRILRPDGLLILTTHGARYADRLDPEERARFDAGAIVVRWEEVEGTNLCATFHPPEAVRRLASERGFVHVESVAEGALGNPHQDLHVFRKPSI